MNKSEVVKFLVHRFSDYPIIFTTGLTCRIAQAFGDRDNHFYMTGSMGLTANVGHGVALASGMPVVIVDGDGSIAMNPAALIGIGHDRHLAILHLVLDDGCYASTGRQAVPVSHLDLCNLARAVGYRDVAHAVDVGQVQQSAQLFDRGGAQFVHCALAPETTPAPPRVETALPVIAHRFTRRLSALAEFRAIGHANKDSS